MGLTSVNEFIEISKSKNIPLWQVVLESDCEDTGITPEESMEKMALLWHTMKESSKGYNKSDKSSSKLVGGDGGLMEDYISSGNSVSGGIIPEVIKEALKMGECNACMKRIVAAPTAGSCGVLPAVLIPLQQQRNISDEDIIKGLYVSAGFGQIIAYRASISGAEGGCQAEVGSASAMASATIVYLCCNISNIEEIANKCANACAMSLKNLLGLVCDPVAGLVEVPCVKRNVIGAVNAVSCAEMALAGIESKIPVDEVIDAMKEVGDLLPSSLRETGKGGLAGTNTAQQIKFMMNNV